MAYISGVGLTPFGRLPGPDALGWQSRAARSALADADVGRRDVDAVIAGYATTMTHLMPANLLAANLGLTPEIALGASVGGATGLAMVAQAARLVDSGAASCVLVAAGEDRASGQSSDSAIGMLAQVGDSRYEVPLGANIPAYYALLASRYFFKYGLSSDALAPLAVQLRANASRHPGAQFRKPITVDDVVSARSVADPLRLLDCCPLSDGGAALVITRERGNDRDVEISGVGQANLHQHVTEADFNNFGAKLSSQRALDRAGIGLDDIGLYGIYDSFTVTAALLLEEIGIVEPGTTGLRAASGSFAINGELPLNPHGGLLSYGHSGVAGGMAHVVEIVTQMRHEAGDRQVTQPADRALLHADGGVLSAHVTVILGPSASAQSGQRTA